MDINDCALWSWIGSFESRVSLKQLKSNCFIPNDDNDKPNVDQMLISSGAAKQMVEFVFVLLLQLVLSCRTWILPPV